MSLASIHSVQGRPSLGPIEVTVSMTERHTMTAEMPKVPIERGSDLTDHREIHPAELTMEGVISAVALRSDGQIDANGRVLRGNAVLSGAQPFSIQEGYVRMLELFEGSATFVVTTSLRSYTDMHFQSLEVVRDKTTGGIVKFSAHMVQLSFASSATARVRSKVADKPKTPVKEKPGSKPAKPTENKSTLRKIGEIFSKDPGTGLKNSINALR